MRSSFSRSADYAEGVRDAGETVLLLADTSCQWDFREFRVRRGQEFRGKEIRDAVVASLPPPCVNPWGRGSAPWFGITGETHRALPWVRITGCGRRIIHSARQQFPRERSGEKSFNPSEQARADRDHAPRFLGSGNRWKRPQVSRQWKHWKSQTTQSVSGPVRPAARVSGQCCANHLPGFRWDLTSIYQPAREPPPTAPSAPTSATAPG